MRSRLFTDTNPIDQPTGTYRYAQNAVSESEDGDMGRVSTERGTSLCQALPAEVVGEVYMTSGEVCLFFDNDEIGIVKDCVYTPVVTDQVLNLDPNFPVDGTFRLVRGCEKTVYFTDGVNKPKVVNLDTGEVSDIFKDFTPVNITAEPQQGGVLEVGAYFIAIQYLDANLNPTPYFNYTGPFVLVEGRIDGAYPAITGNFTDEVDPINGAPNSGKSLSVTVGPTDMDFDFYRLAVGVATAGTGSIQQIFVSPNIPIDTTTFTITSFTGWATTTLQDIAVDPVVVGTAQHIEQLENRLLLANVTTPDQDWVEFQRITNNITSSWFLRNLPIKNYEPQADKYHDQSLLGYMGGEAYVFGVVYLFADGSQSPVFIIPPPEASTEALEELTVVGLAPGPTEVNIKDVRHLGLSVGDTVPRWKVFNTGGGNVSNWGYYEGEATYPETLACDSTEFVWGDLAGEKVRYHVFPNNDSLTSSNRTKRTYGVQFDNIVYPPGVVGHFFVRANKQINLVEGTGYVHSIRVQPQPDNDVISITANAEPFLFDDNPEFVTLINPELFHNKNISFNYVTAVSQAGAVDFTSFDTIQLAGAEGDDLVVDVNIEYKYIRLDDTTTDLVEYNRQVDEFFNIPASLQPGTVFRNINGYDAGIEYGNNPAWIVRTDDQFPITSANFENYTYVQLRNSVDPYPNYSNLVFQKISQLYFAAGNDFECYGGDTFVSEMNYNFLKNFFGGGSEYTVRGTLYGPVYFETRISSALRLSRDEKCFLKFDPSTGHLDNLGNTDIQDGLSYISASIVTDDLVINPNYCQDNYLLNPDLYSQDQLRFYSALSFNFDYCRTCLGVQKNRIVYSEQGFQEEQVDSYRVFLANNYKDIEAETGQITDLARYNDILYVFTEDAIWYQPASVQERASSTGLVSYVGTGDFLALPEKRITNYDRIGTINKWSTIPTPYGVVTVDTNNGQVYLLNQTLTPLTEGVSRELREKMGNRIQGFAPVGFNYKYGAIAAYDEEYDRLLITYKDYVPKAWGGVVESADGIFNTVFYDGDFFINLDGFGRFDLEPTNKTYFEDYSFTISRSFKDGWTGYHSYIPEFYAFGESFVYSSKRNSLWRHNIGDFLVYYGTSYSHIVEPVYVSPATSTWDDVRFITYATRDGADIRWKTFDKVIAYNSYQSSDLQNLIPKNILEGQDYLVNILQQPYLLDQFDEWWSINGLRDLVGTYEIPLFTQSDDLTITDKVPNVLAFTGKEWFETEPLRDQYLIVRLIYEGPGDIKLTTALIQSNGRTRG